MTAPVTGKHTYPSKALRRVSVLGESAALEQCGRGVEGAQPDDLDEETVLVDLQGVGDLRGHPRARDAERVIAGHAAGGVAHWENGVNDDGVWDGCWGRRTRAGWPRLV